MTRRVCDIELLNSQTFGGDGFLRLRRLQLHNLRDDGSRSQRYPVDLIERPLGLDAVVVLPFARDPTRVMLRRGLRPVLRFGRAGCERDGRVPPLELIEAVAGILEPGDLGEAGLRRRAAVELQQELGLSVRSEAIVRLGQPLYASSGLLAEQLFFCAVESALSAPVLPPGDGTPMEEGGAALVMSLDDALVRCDGGQICDLKTECVLRRLAAFLP